MLDNFKEIYDDELSQDDNFFRRGVLNSSDIRMFVYEVCKRIVASQPSNPADREKLCDCEEPNIHPVSLICGECNRRR